MKLQSHWILFLSFFLPSPAPPLLGSGPDFSITGQMSQKNGEKKDLTFFEGYQSCCWACYCLCNVWHVTVQWFLGTVQTTAYVPCERLGLQQTATTSGTSQGEISHIWEPQTSVELPLNSSGQNSCAVGESTSRKIRHMVGFPLTSRALLAKVLESVLVEHRNILCW